MYVCVCIYIYIYIFLSFFLSLSLSLSLSLYIYIYICVYIYIYIYTYTFLQGLQRADHQGQRELGLQGSRDVEDLHEARMQGDSAAGLGKGQIGSALMGSLQICCFFDRGTFWVLPLTYFYLPQSSRAYLFSNLSKFITFAAAPLVLTPFVRNQRSPTACGPGGRTCPGRT